MATDGGIEGEACFLSVVIDDSECTGAARGGLERPAALTRGIWFFGVHERDIAEAASSLLADRFQRSRLAHMHVLGIRLFMWLHARSGARNLKIPGDFSSSLKISI
ncbi:hypothetical protein CTATCC11996_02902 [Comamonas testosteroni ATCC 11996]|nr:hypothetical protein CTATCC11996_02902 [Comamonas testosteroni ATCC 11996]